ncbi:MAG: hypothetical protein EA345_17290 [Halomonas sp.]|nr:MAG: hypothetical protein EA345_17290 [Halomonas sp.]
MATLYFIAVPQILFLSTDSNDNFYRQLLMTFFNERIFHDKFSQPGFHNKALQQWLVLRVLCSASSAYLLSAKPSG